MDRVSIRRVLQCPNKELLELALDMVNLKDKELRAITWCDIKGYSEEYTSIKLECSKKSIQNWKNSAYKKISKVWNNNNLIEAILDLY